MHFILDMQNTRTLAYVQINYPPNLFSYIGLDFVQ